MFIRVIRGETFKSECPAVVVFSAVSMAKGPQVMKKEIKEMKVARPDCVSYRYQTYVEARRLGLSGEDSSRAAYSAYFSCMSIM